MGVDLRKVVGFVAVSLLCMGTGCSDEVPRPPVVILSTPPPAQLVPIGPLQPGGDNKSNFGSFELGQSFRPDPHITRGRAGGLRNAAALDPSCSGWISRTPDHVFVASSHYGSLRLIAAANEDITLVVRKPDGTYACNDDGEGTNPIIGASFAAGAYQVWVGSYNRGVETPYVLGVTERQNVSASALLAAANTMPASDDRNRHRAAIRLTHGFMPDPRKVQGEGGGRRPASDLGAACAGWISQEPDHVIHAQSPFERLRASIMARSKRPLSLVVRHSSGEVTCTEMAPGGAEVDAAFSKGRHQVWVATGTPGRRLKYELTLSEVAGHSRGTL